jgi:hypothetical protein
LLKWNKIKNPEIFQGSKEKESYFEGWYFKIVEQDGTNIYAIIPGIALNKKGKASHSFIQFFDGKAGKYDYFKYDVDDFHASNRKFDVTIGESHFSSKKMVLDIHQGDKSIEGSLKFKNLVPWKKSILSPGIMGIFSYVPMQTKHAIVSMNHDVMGKLFVNTENISFNEGSKGYIEKDWGSSFPSSWIWMQSNHFSEPELSFVFSVARIPFLGFNFLGFFCVIWYKGSFYTFATHTRAKLRLIRIKGNKVYIVGEDTQFRFEIKGVQGEATDMKAPSLGEMRGHCFESMNSIVHIRLIDKNNEKLIVAEEGKYAGLEIMDNGNLRR